MTTIAVGDVRPIHGRSIDSCFAADRCFSIDAAPMALFPVSSGG